MIPEDARTRNPYIDELEERIRANVPPELLDRPQWLSWKPEVDPRTGKVKKVPYNAIGRKADHTDQAQWQTFDNATATAKRFGHRGVGYVFSIDDPYAGTDLDHCIVGGQLAAQASERMSLLNTYSEYSHSETGVHCIALGKLPPHGRKKNNVEMYDSGRFFVVTGDHIQGTPRTINDAQEALSELHMEVFGPAPDSQPAAPAMPATADDAALLGKMLASKQGAKIQALWDGNIAAYGSASEADAALCNHLAFWTGNDPQRIDRLFRQSGLMREKWDRRARTGETYGQGTIKRCLSANAYYPGSANKPAQKSALEFREEMLLLREFVRSADFSQHVPKEMQSKTGYRTSATDKKVCDAILDMFEQAGKFTAALPLERIQEYAGLGSFRTAGYALQRLTWFVEPAMNRERQADAQVYKLKFVVSTLQTENTTPPLCKTSVCNLETTKSLNSFSNHKGDDAFVFGKADFAKRQGLDVESIGPTPLLVLAALEEHGDMTRQEIAESTGLVSRAVASACRKLNAFGLIEQERSAPREPYTVSLCSGLWKNVELYSQAMKTRHIGLERHHRNLLNRREWAYSRHLKGEITTAQRDIILEKIRAKRLRIIATLYPEFSKEEVTRWVDTEDSKANSKRRMVRDRRMQRSQPEPEAPTVDLIPTIPATVPDNGNEPAPPPPDAPLPSWVTDTRRIESAVRIGLQSMDYDTRCAAEYVQAAVNGLHRPDYAALEAKVWLLDSGAHHALNRAVYERAVTA